MVQYRIIFIDPKQIYPIIISGRWANQSNHSSHHQSSWHSPEVTQMDKSPQIDIFYYNILFILKAPQTKCQSSILWTGEFSRASGVGCPIKFKVAQKNFIFCMLLPLCTNKWNQKKVRVERHYISGAITFCKHKGNSEKYKGKSLSN